MLNKNFKLIYKYLNEHYAKQIEIDDFNCFCEALGISKKEYLEIFILLTEEKSIVNRGDNTFIPLINCKIIYSRHKLEIKIKVIMYLLGIISTILAGILLELII